MGTDAQVTALDTALSAASAAITTLSNDVSLLVTALQNHPAAPDLTNEITAAQALSTGIANIDATVQAALNPTPVSVAPGSGTTAPSAADTVAETTETATQS